MSGSVHDKLNRVRKPRVHITYDVETEGAEVQRELPFVMGVMGAFSGDPTAPLKSMVDLKFTAIEDFEPARVAQQVPALRTLMETRAKLRDLMSKVDRSEELESLLEQVLKSEDEMKSLSGQLGIDKKET